MAEPARTPDRRPPAHVYDVLAELIRAAEARANKEQR